MTGQRTKNKKRTEKQSLKALSAPPSFEASYPNISAWVSEGGWVEIGDEVQTGSFIRALDEGGMVWEGAKKYRSVDDALQALERGIAEWREGNY